MTTTSAPRVETVTLEKLPPESLRMFGTWAEAERYAARYGEVVYYVSTNHTWYVVDRGR